MPIACISAYIVVGPTKRNPRRFRSLLSAVDRSRLRREVDEPLPAVARSARRRRTTRGSRRSRRRRLRELAFEPEQRLGVVDDRRDLGAVAHDPRVEHELLHAGVGEARDLGGLEAGEAGAVALALVEDRPPRQPGLRALEAELLEQADAVVLGDTPLDVVVVDHERVVARPRAAARSLARPSLTSRRGSSGSTGSGSGRAGPGTSSPSPSCRTGARPRSSSRRTRSGRSSSPGRARSAGSRRCSAPA